jgi:hypothetical protein
MAKREYYYLVAGLPDLARGQAKAPLSLLAFRWELRERLHPEDYELVEWLFLPADNLNFLRLLQKKELQWDSLGNYSQEQLEEGLREPALLRPYFQTFITAFLSDTPIRPGMSWENQLTELFYDYALANVQGFLYDWFTFERQLRNILTAFNARKWSLPLEAQLIGHDEVTEAIIKTRSRDFGLGSELPYIERLLRAEEQNNPLDREWAIDELRWETIGELNTFNYFSIEVILGFVLRLAILERWQRLDPERGAALFRRLIDNLERDFRFPNEFTLP